MKFDAIVIGGGHAGIEAVRALHQKGFACALITLDPLKIGAMSCNPAIGGVAKGHLVYEIDALGGWMGQAADLYGIQTRRLNLNKGPAVRSTRVQCDKDKYQAGMSARTHALPNVRVIRGEAKHLYIESGRIAGVDLASGERLFARVVVVTSGTFMGGVMFCGDKQSEGGRIGDKSSVGLSASIRELGHSIKRLKTGTPARLKASTIDFSKWQEQWGDAERRTFSWKRSHNKLPQICCYIAHTTAETHDVIRRNFERSPLYSGDIVGVGPRYCPSIEDKVRRFPDRERHQIFLEPEGLDCDSVYPNGMSTSLPEDVQLAFLRTLPGLSRVELLRPGYAVEYDVFDPMELTLGLRSRLCEGLYFAGQVNRTSGYEEAAAQGLWAGLQAGRYLSGQDELLPDRSRSYIETLVDDLVRKGTEEPYRMFTSRSEFRLLLREDNSHERMFALACSEGLLEDEQKQAVEGSFRRLEELKGELGKHRIRIDQDRVLSFYEYLKRPEVSWESLDLDLPQAPEDELVERVEIEAKYSGYLERQRRELEEFRKMHNWRLKEDFDLSSISSLSTEVVEKVSRAKPRTVLELASISGVTPAAVLLIARQAGFVSRETLA